MRGAIAAMGRASAMESRKRRGIHIAGVWRRPVQRLFPRPSTEALDDAEPYAHLHLADAPDDRPYVIVNMVTTVDGKVTLGGVARGIGSRTDRRMMRVLRSNVDALLVGAETLRAEPVDPRLDPDLAQERLEHEDLAHPLAVTVSRSLDLNPKHRFFVHGPARSVIFTTRSAAASGADRLRTVATVIPMGDEAVDLTEALSALRKHWSVRRLLCEGGPLLNQQLLSLGLLDELFLTLAPKLAGGSGPGPFSSENVGALRASLNLVSLYEADGELFARYRVRQGRPS